MRTAVAIDPLSAVSASNLAITLAKDPATYAEARAFARRSLALDPSNFVNVNNSALAMIMTGEVAEATAMVRNVPTDAMQAISVGAMRVEIFAAEGQHDSLVALSHAVDGKSDVTRGWEAAASAHAALGQWDRAFELAETITKNTPTLDWIFQVGPIWRPAAHDPRMRALCTRTHWNCDRLIGMLDRTVPLRKYP
jgi:hypothetical protein